MFSKKESTTSTQSQRNLIGHGTEFNGDIISNGDFRIDGKIEGNIKTNGKLFIGKEGFISGTIDCKNADIEGHFSGKIICKGTLNLKTTAVIEGEVYLEKLSVEPGAVFNASCSMKGVKELNKNNEKESKEKSAS